MQQESRKKEYRREYYAKNRELLIARARAYYAANLKSKKIPLTPEQRKEKNRQKAREKYADPAHAEKLKTRQRLRYWRNLGKSRADRKSRRIENIEKYRETARLRYHQAKADPQERMRRALRRSIQRMVESGGSKQEKTAAYLGAPFSVVRNHLENNFKEGMSWSNYGEWHIDHIKPLNSFDLSVAENMKLAGHYTNLQPLWALENLEKGCSK